MNEALLNYINRRHLDKEYIEKKCKIKDNSFCIPLRNFTGRDGRQERYLITNSDGLKSKTEYGST